MTTTDTTQARPTILTLAVMIRKGLIRPKELIGSHITVVYKRTYSVRSGGWRKYMKHEARRFLVCSRRSDSSLFLKSIGNPLLSCYSRTKALAFAREKCGMVFLHHSSPHNLNLTEQIARVSRSDMLRERAAIAEALNDIYIPGPTI